MAFIGLTSGEEFLRAAAHRFFEDHYEQPTMYVNVELHKDLQWTPALRFVIHDYINVFVEPSEIGPYPRILERKYTDVLHFPQPISVYAVCPEEMILTKEQRSEMKRLQSHGFGLITVDGDGNVHMEFSAKPLIHVISKAEYKTGIEGLPRKIRQRIGETFEDYNNKPVNGVRSLTEVVEGIVVRAGKDAVRQSYLSNNELGSTTASTLQALRNVSQLSNARAVIGGIEGYHSAYRNLAHHWPKNKKKAYQKYTDCRHAYLDGIKQIKRFRTAMKDAGLSGNLPRG